jgi:hypothetical protein
MFITVQAVALNQNTGNSGLVAYKEVDINTDQITFTYKDGKEDIVTLSCGTILKVKDYTKAIDIESQKRLFRGVLPY